MQKRLGHKTFSYKYGPIAVLCTALFFIAMPPLYKAMPKKGEEEYLYDDKALERYRKTHDGPFTLQRYNGKMRITTRGVGHGLGMSQYSAHRMAKDGQTYDEILNYFFEGCEQKEVAEILQNTE